jgi:hypothetical protein
MRRVIVWLAVIMLLPGLVAFAATRTATFTWTQDAASLPKIQSWRVYSASTSGGPYTQLAEIAYDGSPKPSYTGSATLTQADGTAKTWYFICRAHGKNGIESGNSNEVSAVIDLTVPGTPVSFTVTISL